MSTESKLTFGLATVVLTGAIVTGLFLIIRIASLDADSLAQQSYEQYRIVHHAAERHRACFRNVFWLMPALASLLSFFGWAEYFKSAQQDRSPTQTVGGVVVTFLSVSLLIAVAAIFLVAGGH